MARIAVVHVPFYSHIEAAMRLTRVLVRQGHELVAWAPEGWRERLMDVCDGGCNWGAVYDPDKKRFTDLTMNGVA